MFWAETGRIPRSLTMSLPVFAKDCPHRDKVPATYAAKVPATYAAKVPATFSRTQLTTAY